jgi:DNA polymerase III gamma/tau subunit
MMARGFKPVGWVAGVAAAALGCYMLSLNVASERAELAKLERSIIMTKRDIRTLQTELGTRGRLQQLESWNANVLALSAPTSAQFLESEVTLARFDQREPSLDERSVVHMAAAPAAPAAPAVEQKVQAPVRYASAPAAEKPARPLVHQASLVVGEAAPALPKAAAPAPAPAKPAAPVKVAAAEKKAEKKAVETASKPAKEEKKAAVKTAAADKPEKKAETPKKAEPVKKAEAAAKKPAAGADKLAKNTNAPKAGKGGNATGQ